jgi:predicted transcriptional regulator with HTH domain
MPKPMKINTPSFPYETIRKALLLYNSAHNNSESRAALAWIIAVRDRRIAERLSRSRLEHYVCIFVERCYPAKTQLICDSLHHVGSPTGIRGALSRLVQEGSEKGCTGRLGLLVTRRNYEVTTGSRRFSQHPS